MALALLVVAGVVLMGLLSGGARGTQRASELQLATVMASRVVDRLVAEGYARLAGHAGSEGELDLAALEEPAEATATTTGPLLADGFTYRGSYAIEERAPGLLALRVTLSWSQADAPEGAEPVSMTLLRYVGDRNAALAVREPIPR